MRGVIFDLDGTLVDTEVVWNAALDDLLSSKYGQSFDLRTKPEMMGKPKEEAAAVFKRLYRLPTGVDDLIAERLASYARMREQMGVVQPMPGADALVRALHAAGVPLGVATSENRPRTEDTLRRLGWDALFSAVTVSDEVLRGKPAPDIYAEAARRLGCGARECVAVEDAPAGVESARAAGLKVIGVRDARWGVDLSAADLVVPSLTDLTVDRLRALVVTGNHP